METIEKDKITKLASSQKHQEFGRPGKRIRLADFIHKHTEDIVTEWSAFARTLVPAANNATPLALRDHIYEILAFIVRDIESPQSSLEQVQKLHGDKERTSTPTAAEAHAALRLAGGG